MMNFNRETSHKCPCHHCPDKGCGAYHNKCEKYLNWRKELDERNAAERQYHQSIDTMSDAKKKASWRSKRYSRQLTYSKSTKAD